MRVLKLYAPFGIGLIAAFGPSLVSAAADSLAPRMAMGQSLYEWLGRKETEYFYPGASVARQIDEGLADNYPDEQLPNGVALLSGCRPQSCHEKAAVIVTPNGTVSAAALVYFDCSQQCDLNAPRLTIFVQRVEDKAGADEPQAWAVEAVHRDWVRYATRSADDVPLPPGAREPMITDVKVVVVP